MRYYILILIISLINTKVLAEEILEISKQYAKKITFSTMQSYYDGKDPNQEIIDLISQIITEDFKGTIEISPQGMNNYYIDPGIIDLKHYQYNGIMYVLNIEVQTKQDTSEENNLIVSAKLYDVASSVTLLEKKYAFSQKTLRKVAHVLSDLSYYAMTGKKGFFQSKILFASSDAIRTKGSFQNIFMIDQDGFGENQLTKGHNIYTSPVFDKNKNAILYTDMTSGQPIISAIDIKAKTKLYMTDLYSSFPTYLTATPKMCNLINCILFTAIHKDGSSNLAIYQNSPREITLFGINTSPSAAPDDSEIVYESNKDGKRNLYITGLTNLQASRMLTGNDGVYAEPSWSPDGNWIAFTKIRNGLFHLGIIRPNGTEEQIIYSSYMLEHPTWMPNSDMILFAEKKSYSTQSVITIVDLSGNVIRTVTTSTGAVAPSILKIN